MMLSKLMELFQNLGKLVKIADATAVWCQTTLAQLQEEAAEQMATTGWHSAADGLPGRFLQLRRTVLTSGIGAVAAQAQQLLTDRNQVIQNIEGLSSGAGVTEVLERIYEEMLRNQATVLRNVPQVTGQKMSWSKGSWRIAYDRHLDGYSSPARGVRPLRYWAYDFVNGLWPGEGSSYTAPISGLACPTDIITLRYSTSGHGFQVCGNPGDMGYSAESEGSDSGGWLPYDDTLLTGGGFEDWTDGVPVGWTITGGSGIIGRYTADKLRGQSCLAFTGDGNTGTVKLQQSPSLTPLRRYALGLWVRRNQVEWPTATKLYIGLEGTGYTPGMGEQIVLTVNNIPTEQWGHYWVSAVAPVNPQGLVFRLLLDGQRPSGARLLVDDVRLLPVWWHGGVWAACFPGADDAADDDEYRLTVSRVQTGRFAEFFRKLYGFQLPGSQQPNMLEEWAG